MAAERSMVRTQIYIDGRDHRSLKREARRAGTSMTGLVRRIVASYLRGEGDGGGRGKEEVLRFVGLGSSGRRDVSDRHDRALDEALRGPDLR